MSGSLLTEKYNDYELELLTYPVDSWTTERLEEVIVTSLYCSLENKICPKDDKWNHPAHKTSKEKLMQIHQFGGFIPANELAHNSGQFIDFLEEVILFYFPADNYDRANFFPKRCCLTWIEEDSLGDDTTVDSKFFNTIASNFYIERTGLPKGYEHTNHLFYYTLHGTFYHKDGTVGTHKSLVGVDNRYRISFVPSRFEKEIVVGQRGYTGEFTVEVVNAILMSWAERKLSPRFYILAEDSGVKTRFSVFETQAKSLFYARDLIPSDEGRQRPILHWVQAHKRRIKEGIEINISQHLRGVSEFNLFGAQMKILCPQKKVSTNRRAKKGFG